MNNIEANTDVITWDSGTAANSCISWPYPNTNQYWPNTVYWPTFTPPRDGIRDWLEGFLEGKTQLTKADVTRLKEKLNG